MKKSEMERDWQDYANSVLAMQQNLEAGRINEAIKYAVITWPSIDGMMQYSKKYLQKEFDRLEVFDVIFRYCPLIFDGETLDSLDAFLKSQRKIDRRTTADESAQLAESRTLMRDARKLWNLIERQGSIRQGDIRQILGGDEERWVFITSSWVEMGILMSKKEGATIRLSHATSMDEVVQGKCSGCGVTIERRKVEHLPISPCGKCRTAVSFVLLG